MASSLVSLELFCTVPVESEDGLGGRIVYLVVPCSLHGSLLIQMEMGWDSLTCFIVQFLTTTC